MYTLKPMYRSARRLKQHLVSGVLANAEVIYELQNEKCQNSLLGRPEDNSSQFYLVFFNGYFTILFNTA